MPDKHFNVFDVFTSGEAMLASQLEDVEQIKNDIVLPKMPEVNRITGQDNDPKFVAYLLQFAAWQAMDQLTTVTNVNTIEDCNNLMEALLQSTQERTQ